MLALTVAGGSMVMNYAFTSYGDRLAKSTISNRPIEGF